MQTIKLVINEEIRYIWPVQVYEALKTLGFPKLSGVRVEFKNATARISSNRDDATAAYRELQEDQKNGQKMPGYTWFFPTPGLTFSANFNNTISVIDCAQFGTYFVTIE